MKTGEIFLRLLRYFVAYRSRIAGGLVAVAVMSGSDAIAAYLIARLFDVLQSISEQVRAGAEIFVEIPMTIGSWEVAQYAVSGKSESMQMIFWFAAAVLAVIIVKAIFVFLREYLMSSVQQKVLMRVRRELFDTVVTLPVRYFDSQRTGTIMSRITNDVNNLEQSLTLIIEISQNIVYALVFATALFFTSWQLTIVTVIVFAISGQISRSFGDRIRSFSTKLTNTVADITSFLQEKISAIRIVKAFTREEHERNAFKTRVESNYHYSMKIVRTIALLSPTNEFFNTAAASLLVVFSGVLFIQGSMSIDAMIFFLIVMINLAKPVKALGESAARIQKSIVSAGFIFEIIDQEREPGDVLSKTGIIKQGSVTFDHVSFSYTNGAASALRDITFEARGGETIALVGPSGAGKSTLIGLIARFYETTQGSVRVDGVDVRDMALHDLRSALAIVPQDTILFSGSVFENILYGRLSATREEVLNAAKASNAHSFIESLEKGYETEVGERGAQLSGGQRQRIAIARALLRDPRILLLDEATSALDSESEQMVQEALGRLLEGRTSFIIAHRLSTISRCNRILVLQNGELVESGTHDELLSHDSGLYKRLHALQFTAQSSPS